MAAGAQVRGQPGGGAHAADLPPPRQRQAQRTLPAGERTTTACIAGIIIIPDALVFSRFSSSVVDLVVK